MITILKRGFTLAEVLITLLIIGVVASLVIPAIITNTNKAEYVTKLKKEYAVLSQAFTLLALDAGGSILNDPNLNSTTDTGAEDQNAMNAFATKLNGIKNCGLNPGCFKNSPIKFLDGKSNFIDNIEDWWGSKAVFADGTSIMIDLYRPCTANHGITGSPLNNSVCGEIYVNINGAVGPNILGRDIFGFWIAKSGIYPMGTFGDGETCNISNSSSGSGCAGKVLTEDAMNY